MPNGIDGLSAWTRSDGEPPDKLTSINTARPAKRDCRINSRSGGDQMMSKPLPRQLRRVRLELARDHEFPHGSAERGYDFIAPLDAKGHIDVEGWRALRDRCRVRRFWADLPDEVGHILHQGHRWAFHYDIRGNTANDDVGFRFRRAQVCAR